MLEQGTFQGVRILALDPGTSTMGFAPLIVFPETREIRAVGVFTHNADRALKDMREIEGVHGSRMSRLMAHANCMANLLNTFRPDYIIAESPFAKRRFPNAYGALCECLQTVRMTAFNYRPFLPFEVIDPVSAKQNLGVGKGKGKRAELKDKSLVMQAVLNRGDLSFDEYCVMDEHSYDATAIGLYFIDNQLFSQ